MNSKIDDSQKKIEKNEELIVLKDKEIQKLSRLLSEYKVLFEQYQQEKKQIHMGHQQALRALKRSKHLFKRASCFS